MFSHPLPPASEHSASDDITKFTVRLCRFWSSYGVQLPTATYHKLVEAIRRAFDIQRHQLPSDMRRRAAHSDAEVQLVLSCGDPSIGEACDESCSEKEQNGADVRPEEQCCGLHAGLRIVPLVLERVDGVV